MKALGAVVIVSYIYWGSKPAIYINELTTVLGFSKFIEMSASTCLLGISLSTYISDALLVSIRALMKSV